MDVQSTLADPKLFVTKGYINGKWVDAADKATFAVINPATGATIAEVPHMPRSDVTDAIVSRPLAS